MKRIETSEEIRNNLEDLILDCKDNPKPFIKFLNKKWLNYKLSLELFNKFIEENKLSEKEKKLLDGLKKKIFFRK